MMFFIVLHVIDSAHNAHIREDFLTQAPEIGAHCPVQGGAHIGEVHFQQNLVGRTGDCPVQGGAHIERFYCIMLHTLILCNQLHPLMVNY